MKTMKAAKRTLAILCAVIAASFALTGTAFAATVHGADSSGTGSAIEGGSIDALNVEGGAEEYVLITVLKGTTPVAENQPYKIGKTATDGDQFTWSGTVTLNIAGLSARDLENGVYTIKAYNGDRANPKLLYSGKLYGVYVDLPDKDKTELLIGTRVVNDEEAVSRHFTAPATVFNDGRSYKLKSEATGNGVLHFAYEEYDPSSTMDGVINFIDAQGNVVAKSEYPGIKENESLKLEMGKDIPEVVVTKDGDLYRTVFLGKEVEMRNPDKLSYNMYCTKISEANQTLAGYYVATIKMVDEKGAVIATDTVNVTGNFVYTAPTTIYKKETNTVIEQPAVVTYNIKGSPTIHLSAQEDKDKVQDRARTIIVEYATTDPEAPSVDVTFNLIDGSKRVGEGGRKLGTKVVTATLDSPTVVPEASMTVDGKTYHIAGDPNDYAYTLRSGEIPSVNVYYTPEGYQPPGPYEVKVNYVNYVTNEVIETQTYTSDPNSTGALVIETPASFSSGDVEYVRLDGQEDPIEHSYYSQIAAYVVYYRDVNDTLTSGTVINTIRVVYRDGGTTTTEGGGAVAGGDATVEGGGDAGGDAAGGAAAGGDADGGAAGGADAGDGTQNFQLNEDGTYNVADGDGGNGTLTNESGVDSNTERIDDSATPLASGFGKGGTSSAAGALSGMMLPIGIGMAVVIAVAAVVLFVRRRKNDEAIEA